MKKVGKWVSRFTMQQTTYRYCVVHCNGCDNHYQDTEIENLNIFTAPAKTDNQVIPPPKKKNTIVKSELKNEFAKNYLRS